jgi:hypothetical protein
MQDADGIILQQISDIGWYVLSFSFCLALVTNKQKVLLTMTSRASSNLIQTLCIEFV